MGIRIRNMIILILMLALIAAGIHRIQVNKNSHAVSIPILTYHRLCSDDYYNTSLAKDSEKDLWTCQSDFIQEMTWIHDNGYRTISIDEFYKWYRGELELPKKSVMITFDDGYYNVIKYGLDIMNEYSIKATMFVIGSAVSEVQWDDIPLCYLGKDTIEWIDDEYPNIQFQSHTYNMHYKLKNNKKKSILSQMSYDDILRDFDNQNEVFNDRHFEYLAFPYGLYNEKFIKALKEKDYKLGFTYNDNRAATRKDERYKIPRIGVRGDLSPQLAVYRWLEEPQ